MRHVLRPLLGALGLTASLAAPHHLSGADSLSLDVLAVVSQAHGTRVHNRSATSARDAERSVLALDARPGDGLAWFDTTDFASGVIECDIRGRNDPGRSFVGIAFHGVDESTFEAIYFRPFNFASPDPARRAHSVQYISMPEHDWSELRQKHPGVYESDISPAPEPDAWLHARIVVSASRVSVFVNGASEPCLSIARISHRASGWVGLWVGNGSDGMFANLEITPAEQTPPE